ncbi:MAG: hypothetical protein JWM93_2447 [Frankiales bacterium]|nr:hypothetical protein [Frankiales bacterium]
MMRLRRFRRAALRSLAKALGAPAEVPPLRRDLQTTDAHRRAMNALAPERRARP